ncbi:MAG: archaellin/type IV pilin N-terminal domain-containing protein [Candidatus Pacearchaeota archaeon]
MGLQIYSDNKKAISPVVATVVLIAMAVIIALIIFIWASGIFGEDTLKFGSNIKNACSDVSLDISVDEDIVQISNTGSVPVSGINAKISDGSSKKVVSCSLSKTLTSGSSGTATCDLDGGSIYSVIPILTGTKDSAEEDYACSKYEILA